MIRILSILILCCAPALGASPFFYCPTTNELVAIQITAKNSRMVALLSGSSTTNSYTRFFIYNTNSTATLDGKTVFKPTNQAGRWEEVNVIDAASGFRVAGTAGSGNYLRGNGTSFVEATIADTDLGLSGTPSSTTFLRGDRTWQALAGSFDTQTANTVLSGPTSGGAATPAFRALVASDIPSLDAAKITSGTMATARLGSGTASSSGFLRGDQTWSRSMRTLTGVIGAVGNVGVGEDILQTYTIPAGTVSTLRDRIVIRATGIFTANANAKTVKLYIGATVIFTSTSLAFNGGSWVIACEIMRSTTDATQHCSATWASGPTSPLSSSAAYIAATEDFAADVILKCTGEATSDDDIIQKTMSVEFLPTY